MISYQELVRTFPNAVYVLHCFNKKTKRTSEHDKHIAKVRYRTALQEDRNQK
ncbi:type II toxin-antitoxin system RelE/ParE family toxin [Citrobacter freundii]|nr:type II toxin-antitoxin system RelE/ParE family toxin [Citrobacter freundii]WHW84608.1 type II toxin-antitoxin system RelE/ParE family toxin [Citrobacter freundii]WHW94760.1 type II toxin-antitoxin system RelE/ParE family toxin [Citrobacter freundii]